MAKKRQNNSPHVAALLRTRGKKEALDWLSTAPAGVTRAFGALTPDASVALAQQLYRMGAEKVYAAKIGSNANGKYESTETLICALPSDPAGRKQIFQWDDERVREFGVEGVKDTGQTHILIWFD